AFVTQSTLSASIKELENLLEATLVDRSKRTVVLTPLGAETVERARKIIADCELLTRAVRTSREPLCGTLRLGAIPTISPFLLPKVLPQLRRAYSQLKLYLVEDQTARLIESLHDGQIDVALLALPYDCGAVETEVLFDDPLLAGLPMWHPLASSASVMPDQLSEDLLLLKDGHCLRDHALSACQLVGPRTEGFEATSLPTLVQMVDNGLGTTLLPALAVDAGVLHGTDIVVRPLQSDAARRTIGLVWRRGTGRQNEFKLLAREFTKLAKSAPQNMASQPQNRRA
ncbi:MAG TPA: LysR substrate-binding domain-containing protein, partial [Bradyrhizobium sp.]|nr:LysR substrate-binding domain-containing protein [Bradyrhizobium sp.]